MASVAPDTDVPRGPTRWGLGDAVGGWIVAYMAASLLGSLLYAAAGYSAQEISDGELPLSMVALGYPPLWLGFVGIPVWAAATKGNGWVRDFRARFSARSLPFDVLAGIGAQLLVVPLVSLPMLWLTNTTQEELGRPARELSEKAHGAGGILLFILIVGIGAPVAEELFFRGLLMRALEKRFGTAWAVVGSAVVFGATHFQFLQFPALTCAGLVFAWLVVRSDSLWSGVVGHTAFNMVTVVNLVWLT
jgi:membrane protease YdiL (CAAX protease family)